MNIETERLRIFPLIDDYYNDIPFHLLDYARMLKRDVALEKEVTFQKDGRPLLGALTHGEEGSLIEYAQLGYVYTLDPENFLVKRQYVLRYWVNGLEGEEDFLSEPILIKSESLTTTKKAYKKIQEREESRAYILKDIKVTVLGILKQALQLSTEQVVALTDTFWRDFDLDIKYFVRNGSSTWRNSMLNGDLTKYVTSIGVGGVNWLTDIPNPFGEGKLNNFVADKLDF